jgi:hypothetical protein
LAARPRLGTLRFRRGGFVTDLAFTPDGKTIVSHGRDGAVCAWDVAAGRTVQQFTAAGGTERRRASLTPDGRWLAAPGSCGAWSFPRRRARTASRGGSSPPPSRPTARPWQPPTAGRRSGCSTSPADRRPRRRRATGRGSSSRPCCCPAGRPCRRWNPAGRRYCGTRRRGGYRGGSNWAAADGRALLAVDAAANLLSVDFATGRELRRWPITFGGRHPVPTGVAESPDGTRLALVFQSPAVVLADAATGKELRRLDGHPEYRRGRGPQR